MRGHVRNILKAGDWLVSFVVMLALLLGRFRAIRRSAYVVLVTEGGHGHTVTVPDVTRRLFPEGNPLVIFVSEIGRHNWAQARIWPDVRVIHVLKSIRYHSAEQTKYVKRALIFLLTILGGKVVATPEKIESGVVPKNSLVIDSAIYELLNARIRGQSGDIRQDKSIPQDNLWVMYWCRSLRELPKSPPRLPGAMANKMSARIRALADEGGKIFTIYLREKGRGTDGELRCGGTLQDYVDVITYLRKEGHIILLIGDRRVSECPSEYREGLYDYASLGFDQNWFNIYAALECDYFIGDPGGGALLPCLTAKPRLLTNAMPYGQALPGYLLLYKRAADMGGVLVSMEQCFANWFWSYEIPKEIVILNNTPSELFLAVQEMLSVPPDLWEEYMEGNEKYALIETLGDKVDRLINAPSRIVAFQDFDC